MKSYSENENVAREVSGLENANYFNLSEQGIAEAKANEAREEYNQQVADYENKYKTHADLMEEYAKQFNSVNDMEIKAIGNNMLVYMFNENPFQKLTTSESGLIIDLGGMAPEYTSDETGEIKEEEQFIKVGTVFDAGPDCKYAKDGDCIMFTMPSAIPVPFFNKNLFMVNESRILALINSGLEERFKNIK